jgi:hypothetical protein
MTTLEVNMDRVKNEDISFHQTAIQALAIFAENNPSVTATIYVYGTMSVNFHENAWSEFLIPVGCVEILNVLDAAFKCVRDARSRFSDAIVPSQGVPAFHLEEGLLWQPDEAFTWFSMTVAEITADALNSTSVLDDVPANAIEVDSTDDAIDNTNVENANVLEPEVERKNGEQPSRYRQARSDASVASIRREIERVFGLPEGSVALCGPNRQPLRADARIETLRKRWE